MNKNIKRQAVFPVLVMLVVTALALIGSSFAWFTVANTASVAQITTSAQTDGVQLMLSQDNDRYYTRNLKLNPATATSMIMPDTLYQVSTTGALADADATLLDFYNSKYTGFSVTTQKEYIVSKKDGTVVESAAGILSAKPFETTYYDANGVVVDQPVDGGSQYTNQYYYEQGDTFGEAESAQHPTYIVFDLYIKVDRKADIYLYEDTIAKAQKSSTDTTVANELLQSLRVAFVYLGSVEDPANLISLSGATSTKSVIIWEPQATMENANIKKTYGLSAESYNAGANSSEVEFFAYEQDTTYAATEQSTNKSDDLIVGADKDVTNKTALFSVDGECYSKLRIYVWLEGNDPDCTKAVASKYLMLNIAFFAKDATV